MESWSFISFLLSFLLSFTSSCLFSFSISTLEISVMPLLISPISLSTSLFFSVILSTFGTSIGFSSTAGISTSTISSVGISGIKEFSHFSSISSAGVRGISGVSLLSSSISLAGVSGISGVSHLSSSISLAGVSGISGNSHLSSSTFFVPYSTIWFWAIRSATFSLLISLPLPSRTTL